MFMEHWGSWLALILFLLFLLYTLIVVVEEKDSFIENALEYSFKQFHFKIPSWWGLIEESEHRVRWQRTDTRYDWEAKLELQNNLDRSISIEEDFKNRIEAMEMVFDLDSSDILMPSDFKDRQEVQDGSLELVRIEGTATQKGTERCYLDAFLVRDHKRGQTLFATSLSSVLNGLVEGPYFEEMMLNLRWDDPKVASENS
jgi:hypothetical protein